MQFHLWPFKFSDLPGLGGYLPQLPAFKGETVIGEKALYPIVVQGVRDWVDAGGPDPSWVPTDTEELAADIAKKVDPLGALHAHHDKILSTGIRWAPKGTVGLLNATAWAIHAIEAANQAVKEVKANPSARIDKLLYGLTAVGGVGAGAVGEGGHVCRGRAGRAARASPPTPATPPPPPLTPPFAAQAYYKGKLVISSIDAVAAGKVSLAHLLLNPPRHNKTGAW